MVSLYGLLNILVYNLIFLVVIIDPGIKVDKGYKTYDNGLEMGVFIRVCMHLYNYAHKI